VTPHRCYAYLRGMRIRNPESLGDCWVAILIADAVLSERELSKMGVTTDFTLKQWADLLPKLEAAMKKKGAKVEREPVCF